MKKIKAIVLCLAVLLVAGCEGNLKPTAWVLHGEGADAKIRAGAQQEDIEVFLCIDYFGGEFTEKPDQLGVGVIRHFTIEARVEDTPERSFAADVFEGLVARPYAGASLDWGLHGSEHRVRPTAFAGSTFALGENPWAYLVIEGQAGEGQVRDDEEYGAFIGLRIQLP